MQRWLILLATTLVLGGLISACGGSSSSTSSSTSGGETSASEPSGSEGSSASNGVAEAKAYVKEHSDLEGLDWPKPPEEPYNPGKGKMAIITCGLAGQGCLLLAEQVKRAVEAAGWEPGPLGDGEFSASVQSGLVQKAVEEKVDGIVIDSIDLSQIKGAVETAEKAGIPMVCVSCGPTPGFPEGPGAPVPIVPTGTSAGIGTAIGNYVVANSGGKASMVNFVDHAFSNVVERAEAMKAVIEERCPECSYKEVPFPTEDLTKPGPPTFTATLSSEPEVEWVLAPSATFTIPMTTTAEQQDPSLKIAAIDPEPLFLEQIKKGDVAQATVYTPYNYVGWAGVDEVIRQAAGLEPWPAEEMPYALITKANVDQPLSVAPRYYSPPDFNYEAMFKKLWSGK
jgi:ABC-type sugar transport system substrate-binding protein